MATTKSKPNFARPQVQAESSPDSNNVSPMYIRTDSVVSDSSKDSELHILTVEYQMLRQDILQRIDGQRQLTNYTIALIGAGLALIGSGLLTNLNVTSDLLFVFLAIPIFLVILLFISLREDVHIYTAVIYTSVELRNRVETLVNANKLLYWEQFLWEFRTASGFANSLLYTSLATSRYMLPLFGAIGSMCVYIALDQSGRLEPIEIAALVIDGIMLSVVVALLWHLSRWVDRALDPDNPDPARKRSLFRLRP